MLVNYLRWFCAVWQHPGNRQHRLRAILSAGYWFLRQRFTRQPLIVEVFGSMKFACYLDSYMGKHVCYFSDYADYDALHFLHAYLRPGDSMVDVGANAGLYTLLAAQAVGSGGQVLAVEPQPRSLEILRHNLTLNVLPQVQVLPIAASDRDGSVAMTAQDVFAGIAFTSTSSMEPQISVRAERLDPYLGNGVHALCKIDIEGYEWPALRGMEQAIARGQLPIVLFEMNGCIERYGMRPSDFYTWLHEHGYALASYEHDARLLTFKAHPEGDVFAINDEGRALIQQRLPELRLV